MRVGAMTKEEVRDIVLAVLTSIGMPDDELNEIAEDFRYMRKRRKNAERLKNAGITSAVAILVGSFFTALGLGIKTMLGR